VRGDAEPVNLLQFPSAGEPLFFRIRTRESTEDKPDSVDYAQIKTTKASDDYDQSDF